MFSVKIVELKYGFALFSGCLSDVREFGESVQWEDSQNASRGMTDQICWYTVGFAKARPFLTSMN